MICLHFHSVYFYIHSYILLNEAIHSTHRKLIIISISSFIQTSPIALLSTFSPFCHHKHHQPLTMQSSKHYEQIEKLHQSMFQNLIYGKLEEQYFKQLSECLFPAPVEDVYTGLYEAINVFYISRINKNVPVQEITQEFHRKCEEVKNGVPELMRKVFQGDFYEKLKSKYENAKDKKNMQVLMNVSNGKSQKQDNKKAIECDVIVLGSNRPKENPKPQNSSIKSSSKHEVKKTQPNNSEVDYVRDLASLGLCLCEKEITNKQNTFVCMHCGYTFHLQCMKKKAGAQHCSMCHLQNILPNKQVKKVLFMGLLKKNKKKHELSIHLSDDDLTMKYRLQIRCLRLKEHTQFFILFPDYANIVVNHSSVKEYTPLPRQSSLKYRKDQPVFAEIKHLVPKENKITIHEQYPSKDNKDFRLEPENHLIGVFMIQDKKIQPLVKEISLSCTTTFEQSRKMLDATFRVDQSGTSDEVTCEVVKIPLSCSISMQRLKLPARGIFCTHYQCFDLYNFFIITSSTLIPKWVCPQCKKPTYAFRIDSILLAILTEYQADKGTEVMFFKSGEFTVHAGDKLIQGKISNINDLPIQSQGKRSIQPPTEPQRKKKKIATVPMNVISLDD